MTPDMLRARTPREVIGAGASQPAWKRECSTPAGDELDVSSSAIRRFSGNRRPRQKPPTGKKVYTIGTRAAFTMRRKLP